MEDGATLLFIKLSSPALVLALAFAVGVCFLPVLWGSRPSYHTAGEPVELVRCGDSGVADCNEGEGVGDVGARWVCLWGDDILKGLELDLGLVVELDAEPELELELELELE